MIIHKLHILNGVTIQAMTKPSVMYLFYLNYFKLFLFYSMEYTSPEEGGNNWNTTKNMFKAFHMSQ